MTRIVIASDSFKGSADSKRIGECIEKGILRIDDAVETEIFSIADGGEGTVKALVENLDGVYHEVNVQGPYNAQVAARFGMLSETKAVVEMAEASGLHLKELNDSPVKATTYGTGELIKAALDKGATELFIGLGGSATNDGGAGMAQALGAKLLDSNGNEIAPGIEGLKTLSSVDISSLDSRLAACTFTILSDVTNPLTGVNGATEVFGPQKGVAASDIEDYDGALEHYADLVETELQGEWKSISGAGAAGGLGFGLMAFCNAEMKSGIDEVLKLIQLDRALAEADLVITGEGKMDGQSIQGKAPVGIAKAAKRYNLPVIAIVGGRENNMQKVYQAGIDLIIDLVNRPMTLEEAISEVEELAAEAGETAYRAFRLRK
ncbi:glycerate kinase [Marinilactibacillus piezotolerans]|uniref:glycerate kinase n=1 Tax=Marinilactibacillus piezotolerans TaxID=258723 RepID=UPI0009B0C609|nr:glycerate kinase [Marinilactibacillus piezotolerans]